MPRRRRRACWGGQAPGGTPWRCGKRPLRHWGQGGLRQHAVLPDRVWHSSLRAKSAACGRALLPKGVLGL
eukprot:1824681-Alexandrium_andersonii.AAC.1